MRTHKLTDSTESINRKSLICGDLRFFHLVSLTILLITSIILTGCGYQFGQGGVAERYSTISVPIVQGDRDGVITASIIRKITESGAYEYRNWGGALVLNVKVIDVRDQNIGFRYDREKGGKLDNTIIPAETRLTAIAEVSAVDSCSQCTVLGPVFIRACVEFDHDYYNSRDGINVFSLGQVSDYDEAYDAAQRPLSEALATKIVDYVNESW